MLEGIVSGWRKRYARNTAYSYRQHLKALLPHLNDQGAKYLKAPRTPGLTARATTATPEELARMLSSAPTWLRLFMLLYLQCGLRMSETIRVTPRTYNEDAGTVTLKVKGGHHRTVHLSSEAKALVAAATRTAPGEPYIWALKGHPLMPNGINKAFRNHRDRCGVNRELTPHDLRRTAATILYNETHDLRAAQLLLGHRNLTSTLRYIAPLAPEEATRYSELLNFTHFRSDTKH